MHVLHLIEPGAAGCGPCVMRLVAALQTANHLRDADSDRHEVLVLGNGTMAAAARRCGITMLGAMTIRNRFVFNWPLPLRKLLKSHGQGSRFDIVHAWSERSAMYAGDALRSPLPFLPLHGRQVRLPRLLASLNDPPQSHFVSSRLARMTRRQALRLLVPSEKARQHWMSIGAPAPAVSLSSPAVHPTVLQNGDVESTPLQSAATRDRHRRWPHDDRPFVIAVLDEPQSRFHAIEAVTIAARLALSGRRVTLLVHPQIHGRVEAQRFLRAVGLMTLLKFDDRLREPWRLQGEIDAAICPVPPSAPPLPLPLPACYAMAARVPCVLITGAAPADEELLIGNGVFAVPRGDVNTAAERLSRLYHEPELHATMGSAGHSFVKRHRDFEQFHQALRSVYLHLHAIRDGVASPIR